LAETDVRQRNFVATDHLLADIGGRTVRGGFVAMSAHAAKFAISIGGTAILARLLTPQDYGLIGMVAVATNFVSLLKEMGLSYPTVQQPEINLKQISTLFWVNFGVSVVLIIVMLGTAPLVALFYGEPRLKAITAVTALGFIFGGLTGQHEALLRRQMKFVTLSAIGLTSMLAGYVVGIMLAWNGVGYWSLVFSQLTVLATGALGMVLFCRWLPGLPTWDSKVKSMLSFGGHVTGYSIINYLSKNLDSVLIGKFWGAQSLGLFTKSSQLVTLPSEQIDEPLSTVSIPALSRLGDAGERYRRAYLRMLELVMLITMPFVTIVIVSSDHLVQLVLGSQWAGASKIVFFLGIAALFQPVINTAGWLFLSQGRAKEMAQWSLINAPISVLSILCGLPWGPVGIAASYSLARVIVVNPLMYWFVGRSGPVRMGDFYTQVAPFVCASTGAVLTCLGLRQVVTFSSAWQAIIASSLVVFISTVGLLFLFPGGRSALHEAKNLLMLLRPPKGPWAAIRAQDC
jgi:PST family polysaccharide transporter